MTWQHLVQSEPTGATPGGILEDEEYVTVWVNDTYTVWQYALGAWTHLSIKRRDREPIHDWRHLQQIKDEVVGPDREAVELYPASDRVMDTSNQYHLWVLPKGKRMAIGVQHRVVVSDISEWNARHAPQGGGAVQRPMEGGLTI